MFKYARHEPKNTLLYKIIQEHYPIFALRLAEEERVLPSYIHTEFEDYLKCGLLDRLSLTKQGNIRYELKTPYRNGTTHMIFEPLDFISKLASLIPVPRVHLTRFHGVFAPNSHYRAGIINRQRDNKALTEIRTEGEKRAAMTWAQRLKRAFDIDIKTCEACGGATKVIAFVDDPVVINKIIENFQSHQSNQTIPPLSRAPPAGLLIN